MTNLAFNRWFLLLCFFEFGSNVGFNFGVFTRAGLPLFCSFYVFFILPFSDLTKINEVGGLFGSRGFQHGFFLFLVFWFFVYSLDQTLPQLLPFVFSTWFPAFWWFLVDMNFFLCSHFVFLKNKFASTLCWFINEIWISFFQCLKKRPSFSWPPYSGVHFPLKLISQGYYSMSSLFQHSNFLYRSLLIGVLKWPIHVPQFDFLTRTVYLDTAFFIFSSYCVKPYSCQSTAVFLYFFCILGLFFYRPCPIDRFECGVWIIIFHHHFFPFFDCVVFFLQFLRLFSRTTHLQTHTHRLRNLGSNAFLPKQSWPQVSAYQAFSIFVFTRSVGRSVCISILDFLTCGIAVYCSVLGRLYWTWN